MDVALNASVAMRSNCSLIVNFGFSVFSVLSFMFFIVFPFGCLERDCSLLLAIQSTGVADHARRGFTHSSPQKTFFQPLAALFQWLVNKSYHAILKPHKHVRIMTNLRTALRRECSAAK